MSTTEENAETKPALRLVRSTNPATALGLAVSHLMLKPAFVRLQFGDWSRILVGQINRGHYCLVADPQERIVGFMGWLLTTQEKAEAWVEDRRGLSYADSKAGDCVVINAWSADTNAVTRMLLRHARRAFAEKQTVYYKRHYADGATRPVRLPVNEFVRGHASRG